jgi:hypothetical protein
MQTLQNPNVFTPCIRLSAAAPQPRGGNGSGPSGPAGGKRGGPVPRVLGGDSGRPVRGKAKAVTDPQGSRRWREGETEMGADSADSAEQWRGDVDKSGTTGDAASLHPTRDPRAARRRADRLGCESEESEPRRRRSRRQGGVGGLHRLHCLADAPSRPSPPA